MTRGPLPQSLERLVNGGLVHSTGRTRQRDCRVVPRLECRHRIERRGECEGVSLFNRDVADIRRIDGLDAPFPHGIVHGPGNQIVRHIMQDLILEALLDHARWCLARTKAGNACLARIVARDAVDVRIDDGRWEFPPEDSSGFR